MPALTLSAIRTKVKTLVGENTTTADFFSDAAYYRFIDDAYAQVAMECAAAEKEVTINVVAATASYNVSGIVKVLHADYNDEPLMPITADMLYNLDSDWEQRSGTPEYIVLNHTNEIGNIETAETRSFYVTLYPNPSASLSSGLRIIGLTAPAALTTAADEPSCLPDWAHDAVVYEAAARVLEASGDGRNEALGEAYRQVRDWYLEQVQEFQGNKHKQAVWVKGAQPPRPVSRDRETSINATGRAGSGQ